MVHIYDQKMDAVDRHNQMVENNKVPFKTLKWWKKLILHIINLSIVNSYIIYKECCKTNATAQFSEEAGWTADPDFWWEQHVLAGQLLGSLRG